jgi:hypothetical protein
MSVPIGNLLFLKKLAHRLKFAQRKLYAIFQASDLFLSKEGNLIRSVNSESIQWRQQL